MSKSKSPTFTKKEVEVMDEALQLVRQRGKQELDQSLFLRSVPSVQHKARAMDSAAEKMSEWHKSLLEKEEEGNE